MTRDLFVYVGIVCAGFAWTIAALATVAWAVERYHRRRHARRRPGSFPFGGAS